MRTVVVVVAMMCASGCIRRPPDASTSDGGAPDANPADAIAVDEPDVVRTDSADQSTIARDLTLDDGLRPCLGPEDPLVRFHFPTDRARSIEQRLAEPITLEHPGSAANYDSVDGALVVDDASWLRSGDGLALCPGPLTCELQEAIVAANALSIEAWVVADSVLDPDDTSWPRRIVSFSRDVTGTNATLGTGTSLQHQAAVVRLGITTPAGVSRFSWNVGADEDVARLTVGKITHLAMTWNGASVVFWIDGEAIGRQDTQTEGSLANWDTSRPLTVGSEADGRRRWQGKVYGFSIYDRALRDDEVRASLGCGP